MGSCGLFDSAPSSSFYSTIGGKLSSASALTISGQAWDDVLFPADSALVRVTHSSSSTSQSQWGQHVSVDLRAINQMRLMTPAVMAAGLMRHPQ